MPRSVNKPVKCVVRTVAFEGVDVRPIDAQVQVSGGMPAFTLVGLPDKAVGESRERVRAALTAIGLALPPKRITVNLAPADLPKDSGRFDLAIAIAVLAASGQIAADRLGEVELAGELAAHHAARVAVGAVAGDDPARLAVEHAVRRLHRQAHMVVVLRQAQQAVLPAQVDARLGGHRRHQRFFQVVLLQVDHRRHLVVGLGQQVETVGQFVAREHLAHLPAHAALGQALADAQPVPDLQRALGIADRARADADGVVVVEQHHLEAALRQVERRGQPDRAGADHHHRVALRHAAALLVALGAGAALSSLVSVFPQVVWLSEHKLGLFVFAGLMMGVSGVLQWRNRTAPCPTDPALRTACLRTRKASAVVYGVSVAFYLIGGWFAFVMPLIG